MNIYQAFFLAIIQGLTEFLPVSSSGHLVLFQKLFQLAAPPVFFDVLLHLGTLGSIVIFFWKDIWDLIINWKKRLSTWIFIILGSIPAAFLGFFLNSKIESVFNSLLLVGFAWLGFGIILLMTSKLKAQKKDMTWKDALWVGVAQSIALLPGISRSGSTISAGLARNLPRDSAFRFSFLLAIPAILGATVLEAKDANLSQIFALTPVLSMVIAGLVGYFALVLLQKVLKSEKFYLFGYYCLSIGLLTFLLSQFFSI